MNYSEEELKNKLVKELEDEFEKDYEISKYEEKYKKREIYTDVTSNDMTVKLVYEIQKEITAKEEIE